MADGVREEAQKLSHPNHMRPADGGAFTLPSILLLSNPRHVPLACRRNQRLKNHPTNSVLLPGRD